MPLIDERIRSGVNRQAIVDELHKNGLNISLNHLKQELYRWRKHKRNHEPVPTSTPQIHTPHSQAGITPKPPSPLPVLQNKSDLADLRDQEIDLNELARVGRTLKDKP